MLRRFDKNIYTLRAAGVFQVQRRFDKTWGLIEYLKPDSDGDHKLRGPKDQLRHVLAAAALLARYQVVE